MIQYVPPVAVTTECVRVVVDYGTFADSPPGPNTHCTAVPYDASAADVLARRARDLGATPPRYDGSFLCGIDGYPGSGCGLDRSKPYWSFWIWRNGAWTYSQVGVESYAVEDSDHDGHPDPIGFRYQPPTGPNVTPRASPAYPKATPTPRPTTPAPAVEPTVQPARTSRPATPTTPPPARAARSAPASTAAPSEPATTAPTTPPGIAPKASTSMPVGTVAGGLVAFALLGATAWRFRKPGAP